MSFRALDLNLLKVFEALMTEGSVTRAANALRMTQPAVSNALARLRDALGDPLFVRSGTGIRPTQRAAALWEPIGEALERMRGALDEQVFDPARAQTEFSLSMSDYVSSLVMPDLLKHLGGIAPKARVHTVPNTVLEIGDQLEENRVDCVLSVYVNEAQQPAAIRSRSLWTVDYACFMRRGHPLAAQKRLSIRTFLNAAHVDVSLAGKTLPSYDLFLASRGLSRNLVATVNHYSAAYEVVRQSDLIAVLPSDLRSQSRQAPFLHAMPIPLRAPPRIVSLFWHQRNDTVPAQRWLRETLVGMFAKSE
ncbi:LysR family transcriptional regulator [Bradyrhizobium sp. INPA01-394B]|uniref:LysR family transcriptional regulator n=2 Tax=Bradyrhizobium campsiandrae TaxID=1729892 RepID=A0ABR7U6L5_9BRAD|nr:LysR family transcriptional regulator [Bradyrhizobium campsiandrae]MBC9979191.1 LysR family transcriptional regulator [Bradyrhizobium campsiandrae]